MSDDGIEVSTGSITVTLPLYQRSGRVWSVSNNRYATVEAEIGFPGAEATMVKLHLRNEEGITASATFTLEQLEAAVEAIRKLAS